KETDQELLQDLLRYQREICIDPGYDRRRGKTFVCHYDWPAYFYPLLHSKPQVPLNRGLFQIEVGDQKNSFGMYRKDLDWSEIPDGSQKAKLARFAQQTVSPCYIRNASTYFTEVRALPI
ncbi:MAG: hypothetical protein KDD43_06550, partial [Bdellovibrionales bacterium]|nr:hypothetical protein [Bdellovibrionales bacterium]